jgi:hypothetical protein
LRNCTIAGNTTNGIDGPIRLANTIVAGNSGFDCTGTITSDGHNLIQNTASCTIMGDTTGNVLGMDPKLAALGDNGGTTLTRAIALDSPALDAGDPATPGSGGTACEASDQRGIARPQPVGGTCDIGAFELVYVPTTTTTTSTTTSITGSSSSTVSSLTTTTATTTSTSAAIPTTTPTTSTSLAPPPTSTTLQQAGCGGVPIAPTFVSITCRLAALLLRLNGESGLETFQPKLLQSVAKAQSHRAEAEMLCAAPSTKAVKKAKKRLQQAAKAMTQYVHRLNGLAARKHLDEALRESLLEAGTPIGTDLKTLRGNLQCPGDTAGVVALP